MSVYGIADRSTHTAPLRGLIEGGSLFGRDVPRLFVVGIRRLGFGYTYPVGGAFGFPLRAVGALGA